MPTTRTVTPFDPAPIDAEHVTVEIGKGICEYRGFFVSKTNFDRRHTVLHPAPSKDVFGTFANLWDMEEAVDAFLDRGIEPEDEEPSTGMLWLRDAEEE
jgi:hypothetical protein